MRPTDAEPTDTDSIETKSIPTAIRPSAPEETMRQRFGEVVSDLIDTDERLFVLLSDISVGYLEQALGRHPDRAINLGIMEQTVMSAAAGLATEGFIPVVHSIAPFIVLRPFEQIRDDFLYQGLGVDIVSIGASYDYAEDGYTHHAPDDVPALRALAGVEIVVPGTPAEFEALFRDAYDDGTATYFRLSAQRNRVDRPVRFGRLDVVRETADAPVVVAVGPLLDTVLEATERLSVSVAYCTTVAPFDSDALRTLAGDRPRVAVVEPYYAGALVPDVIAAVAPRPARVLTIGVPRVITTGYGTPADHDRTYGLTAAAIADRLRALLDP